MKPKKVDTSAKGRVFTLIRIGLLFSVLSNIAITAIGILGDPTLTKADLFSELTKRATFIFWGLVTFVLTFGTTFLEKRKKIDIPDILEIVITIFIFAGFFLSARYNLYERFFWWDDLLHTLSGVIIGFIGFITIYLINRNYSMDISPLLVAVFSFTFAVTLGVFWEIVEFSTDMLLGTASQKWDLPPTTPLIGKPFQGSGLRDTMSDLIVDGIGAFITSVITYFMYKNEKATALAGMKKIVSSD